MKLLFRADASHAIGFGHVARILSLVEEATARGHVTRALFGGDPDLVRAWAPALPALDARAWSRDDVIAACAGADAIVLDGPALVASLLPALPAHVRTIVIDDAGELPAPVDAVVNHNAHAPSLSYPHARTRLLGRRYLMLRRDVRRFPHGAAPLAAGAHAPGDPLRVVITFGGSDPVDATSRILALVPPDRPLVLDVIAGPGYRADAALTAAVAAAQARGHAVHVHRAPRDPAALFAGAHAAIASAGGTLGELAYLGCPALAYAIVADQVAPARALLHDKLIAGGRTWADTDDATLLADLRAFLLDDPGLMALRERALASADGHGPQRILDEAIAPAG